MMTKEESTKFVVDFMTPWAGILVQGRGLSHVVVFKISPLNCWA